MSSSEPAKIIASVFALAAFAVAIIAGLSAGNSAARVLGTAVLAMFVCHLLGLAVGAAGERVVSDHLDQLRTQAAQPESRPPAAAQSS